ncbi:fungal-specific transcription factor domain-containing protein [Aspergillus californicus]
MDGGMSEFWIHLNAFKWLQRNRNHSQVLPTCQTERYLNTVFFFQSTLSLTTDCSFVPVQWPVDNQRSAELCDALYRTPAMDDSCLQNTYGVTRELVVFIHVVAVLFQSVSYYASRNCKLPQTLEQTLATLSRRLDAWDIESDRSLLADSTATARLMKLHILAFSHALQVFHLTHLVFPIHGRALNASGISLSAILEPHVSQVSSILLMIEDIKQENPNMLGRRVAPILWPGFIASCEADCNSREAWIQWWERMVAYRIGNIRTLWRTVQDVWQVKDEACGRAGRGDIPLRYFFASWRGFLMDRNRRILAL